MCDFPKFGIQTIFGAQLQSLLRNLAAVCCKQSKTMFGQVFKLMMKLNLFYASYHLLIDGLVFSIQKKRKILINQLVFSRKQPSFSDHVLLNSKHSQE